MRLWYFSSSVNHFSNTHAQPTRVTRYLIFVRPFVHFHTSCVRKVKALARLRGCAGSPEPSLVANVIRSWLIYYFIINWIGCIFLSYWKMSLYQNHTSLKEDIIIIFIIICLWSSVILILTMDYVGVHALLRSISYAVVPKKDLVGRRGQCCIKRCCSCMNRPNKTESRIFISWLQYHVCTYLIWKHRYMKISSPMPAARLWNNNPIKQLLFDWHKRFLTPGRQGRITLFKKK